MIVKHISVLGEKLVRLEIPVVKVIYIVISFRKLDLMRKINGFSYS